MNRDLDYYKRKMKVHCRSLNQASYRDVLSFGQVPLLLRVCVVMIALLLLLAGDVERNPGPLDRPTHESELSDNEEFFDALEHVESNAGT